MNWPHFISPTTLTLKTTSFCRSFFSSYLFHFNSCRRRIWNVALAKLSNVCNVALECSLYLFFHIYLYIDQTYCLRLNSEVGKPHTCTRRHNLADAIESIDKIKRQHLDGKVLATLQPFEGEEERNTLQ